MFKTSKWFFFCVVLLLASCKGEEVEYEKVISGTNPDIEVRSIRYIDGDLGDVVIYDGGELYIKGFLNGHVTLNGGGKLVLMESSDSLEQIKGRFTVDLKGAIETRVLKEPSQNQIRINAAESKFSNALNEYMKLNKKLHQLKISKKLIPEKSSMSFKIEAPDDGIESEIERKDNAREKLESKIKLIKKEIERVDKISK